MIEFCILEAKERIFLTISNGNYLKFTVDLTTSEKMTLAKLLLKNEIDILLKWIEQNTIDLICTENHEHSCINKEELIEKIEELL